MSITFDVFPGTEGGKTLQANTDNPYRLVPFLLLSIFLHVALLLIVRPQIAPLSAVPKQVMEVYFAAPVLPTTPAKQVSIAQPDKASSAQTSHTDTTPEELPVEQPIQATPIATPSIFDSKKFMESAKDIARDEARQTQQAIAAQEKKRLSTPIATLNEYLHQPHKEIRLANGVLKIITEFGINVCFQSAPYFARDSASVFGIPTTCP